MERRSAFRVYLFAVCCVAGLVGCSRPEGLMKPVLTAGSEGTVVPVLVATTRRPTADAGILFTGERGSRLSFAQIDVSVPPGHKSGEIEWPDRNPGDPSKNFVTTSVASYDRKAFVAQVRKLAPSRGRRVMVFIHGYNNRFDDAVYRFAQISYDAKTPAVPVLFTWPSRGQLLAYPYDRESATYSRDALEALLRDLATDPSIQEVNVLAHSMGNWVTLEALRQLAIRNGEIPRKISNVMLAAPDVDVDVARTQVAGMGHRLPRITLFVSQDDRALGISRAISGSTARLGAIDPAQEPYRSAIEASHINVIDLTAVKAGDSLNHGKFAESPEVVQFIGAQLASGQTLDGKQAGLGEHIGLAITGAAAKVGVAASVIVTAPIAVIDPASRDGLGQRLESLAPAGDTGAELAPIETTQASDGVLAPQRKKR